MCVHHRPLRRRCQYGFAPAWWISSKETDIPPLCRRRFRQNAKEKDGTGPRRSETELSREAASQGNILRCELRYGMLDRKKTGKTEAWGRNGQHEASWSMTRHHRSVHVAVSIVQAAGDPRLSARWERCVLCEKALSRKADQRMYQGGKAEGRRCRQ